MPVYLTITLTPLHCLWYLIMSYTPLVNGLNQMPRGLVVSCPLLPTRHYSLISNFFKCILISGVIFSLAHWSAGDDRFTF